MASLDELYRKFGEASEAAQLLETELGNMLLLHGIESENLVEQPDDETAKALYAQVNRQTLGQLIRTMKHFSLGADELEAMLSHALRERNRLSHSFYRQHNFRRNSEEGRAVMMEDLRDIHTVLLKAYKAVMLLSGVDLDNFDPGPLPEHHLPI